MKKITIALLLSLYVLVCQAYDFQVDGIYYVITSSTDKTAAVTYNDGYKYTGNVEIPVRVPYRKENFLITSIGSRAFENCRGLTSVTIPNSVTSIKGYAFSGCKGLSSVSIPNSVTSIGNCAFSGCALLTSITIPNSVTWIGDGAFENCRGLTNITTFNSVTSIGMCAFSNTGWYNNQPDGILYLDKCCLGYKGEKPTGTLTLRDDTRLIAGGAFENCTGLTSVTIPNSVTRIDYGAFLNCYDLSSVSIPNSVTSIGDCAFSGCALLTSITIPNSVTRIGYNAFENCRGLTNITTFNSVTSIGMCAFSNTGWYNNQPDGILYLDKCCLGYKGEKPTGTLTLRDDTRLIAGGAFENCTSLTSVTIPNSVTRIGYDAFLNCYDLTSVEIPNSVTSIGNSAFANCRDLRSVTIGNSVKEIGHQAFFNTERIDVYCKPATPPSCKTDAFEYAREITLYIPIGCKSAYKSATCWENFEYIYETSF